jgi:hypothetical protein
MEILPADWDALQALAGRVGLSAERVSMLRRRVEDATPRPGSPYVLIVGRPDAGIELLLARWLAPEAADELQKTGGRPLVIGPNPGEVRPRLGIWPTWKTSRSGPGHLIALRAAGKPAADTLAQLLSLGHVDEVVLVTRLGQPLHMSERELAQAMAGLAATVRVLVVGLPGEEPTDNELAEVSAFAVSQMRQGGFREGRCLGAGVWFTGGPKRNGSIAEVGPFLAIHPGEVAAGRSGMIRYAVAAAIADIRQKAEAMPVVFSSVAEEECDRLIRELGAYLADLGKELVRQIDKPTLLTSESFRRYAIDAIRSWGAHASIEGHWMKYVERLRPGTQAAFLTEAEAAMELLEFQPGSKPPEVIAAVESSPMVERLIVEAKRAGVGLLLGVVGYVVTSILLDKELNDKVVQLLSYAALGVGAVLGYAIARPIFRVPVHVPRPEPPPVVLPALHGWVQIERRLTGWFSGDIRAKPISPAEECQALALRFGALEQNA